MKVFLDIEGVMMPANSWTRPELLADAFPAFSPKAVQSLNKILSAVDPGIVLTSSNKSTYRIKGWSPFFKQEESI